MPEEGPPYNPDSLIMQPDQRSQKSTTSPIDAYRDELRLTPKEPDPVLIHKEDLKSDARRRARSKRSLLQRLSDVFRGDAANPFVELIVNSGSLEKRVALLIDGVLQRLEVERTGEQHRVGSIFKGKIQNLEPGLKATFVNIGEPKNAFLHYWDISPKVCDSSIEVVRDNNTKDQKKFRGKISSKDVEQHYPVGSDIVVQITKSQIGNKGPRTTTNIAIPGRFLVLMPNNGQCGISRKIEDRKERQRLKDILRQLTLPPGMGVIIRTAGEGKKSRFFIRDIHLLLKKWEEIQSKIANLRQPGQVYQEPSLIERTVRDFLTEDIDRVLVDDKADYEAMLEAVAQISPRSEAKINHFSEDIPIFERFNIARQIEQTYQRRVPLPSGGEIVIEETEALIAIDVNTGGHKTEKQNSKNYILHCNLEAAREAARQVRLRNIGGLIIIDFIDMKSRRDQRTLLSTMRQMMRDDKAKCNILPLSPLGILQMTRQRQKESLGTGLHTSCPYCNGRGFVKSSRTISLEIQRRLVSVIRHLRAKDNENDLHLSILLTPDSLECLRSTEGEQILVDLERHYNVRLSFISDPDYHIENFKIIDAFTGKEVQ